MLERIYIKVAANELECSTRSFRRWCQNNGVGILSDSGSNKQYVIIEEFEAAKLRESIKYVRQKYGTAKLPEVFNSIMNIHTELLSALEGIDKRKRNIKTNYVPAGQHEKSVLERLTKLTAEL